MYILPLIVCVSIYVCICGSLYKGMLKPFYWLCFQDHILKLYALLGFEPGQEWESKCLIPCTIFPALQFVS